MDAYGKQIFIHMRAFIDTEDSQNRSTKFLFTRKEIYPCLLKCRQRFFFFFNFLNFCFSIFLS